MFTYHCPSKPTQIDHNDRASSGPLHGRRLTLEIVHILICQQEAGHVEHSNELERDTDH